MSEKYNNKQTLNQNIGTMYEYFVLDQIRGKYDQVWHWNDFPEEKLFKLGIIKDYKIFCKYRNDMGADLVARKGLKYYFIQCKNFNGTIYIEDLAGFYFFIQNYNGILCYNGKLSERYTNLCTEV